MKKLVTALVTSATIGVTVLASSGTAQARWGWGPGPVVGGLLAGAIIGSALAAPAYPYGYYGPYAYAPPRCYWRTVWNGFRWVRACY